MASPLSPSSFRPARPPYPSSDSPTPASPPAPPPPSKLDSPAEMWSGSAGGGRDTPDELRSPMSGGSDQQPVPAKSSNPLVDLIDSEKRYVEELGAVIRKVAGAWSRANFPPPLLDSMFRSIEGVYKINRSFGSKLKEIGPNPSSPKALGDLLMRWIDDMEPAYTRYTTTYLSSFDHWPPVQTNPNLAGILQDVSAQLQPPPPSSSPSGEWTLDALFLLPYNRLRYYKKLYARLLRSTQPGRNDHNLLVGANERLTVLLETVKARLDYTVMEENGEGQRKSTFSNSGASPAEGGEGARTSVASSGTDSRVSGASLFSANGGRMSNTSASTSFGNLSSSTPGAGLPPAPLQAIHPHTSEGAPPPSPGMSQTLIDIERRLDAERTIDLFTMNPRKVRLQISPPNLPFTRKLRRSLDVEIFFTPNSTGEKVHHHRGYIFILSDLFLVCERMEPHERAQKVLEADGAQGPDLWLCYPPLAGKHLQVAPGPTENHVEVVVMRKETFMLRVEGREMQTRLIKEFNDCIDFAANMPPPNKPVTSPLQTSGPTFQSQAPMSPGFNALSPTSSARSSGVASGGPSSFLANGPNGMTSPTSHQQPTGLTMPMERGGSLPALPPGRAADFRGERVLSQASTYSNGSSNGAPSLPQQMDSMSLGPDGFSRSPMAGGPEGSPMSPPGYGNALPPPRQQSHFDSPNQLPPLPPSDGQAPPRGASLVARPSQSSSNSNASFNQFPPPRGGSHSPLHNGPPPPNGQLPPQLGHPIAQPYPQRGPASMAGQPPSRYASGPLPPSAGGQPMGIPRSQSSASSRSQPSLHPSEQDAPPLPPPHNYPNGPGGPQHPQGGWPPGARGSPGADGISPNGAYPPRNFHSASPVGRPPFDPSVNPNNFPHPPGPPGGPPSARSRSAEPLTPVSLPSMGFSQRALSTVDGFALDDPSTELNSPPPSPKSNVDPATLSGPAVISAAMKCKVFLKKDHASWKSLGAARLKLYHQQSTNVKQVVVESDSSSKTMLISTIVLTDGVERVGKTGVAIEISDQGTRTGIVYMIQLRNEVSAGGFYDSLLVGTSRGM